MFGWNIATTSKLKAIETVTANLMIADRNLNIIYLNGATKTLLQEAEADLKKELPRFDMRTLVGANIDIFHKNPSHQRKMLASLRTQHKATITVGKRIFDLIVTPLKEGEKIEGYVVEWADARTRLQNLDYQNQMEAISRVQAIIAFTPEGEVLDANQNFCDALGYRLEEIRGKHHSMFVDSGYAGTPDYTRFWNELRAGRYQAAEFVRIGKGGKKVVINASYNPITDEKGHVIKVVKFATDVTDRVYAVDSIRDGLKRMASGDLSVSIETRFAADFEAMRENFNAALNQLQSALASVVQATELIDSGSREISHSADDLSKRTEQQAASLEETAAALDEITANVRNASQRADEARQATEAANESAARSGRIVEQAVGAMARIENSSNQISNIIGVIDEIAFQTNLLALNAGVEAARAGEAGKGFAVVAQEVRELAQRSAQAAKEIKELIRNSSEEVHTGVTLVSETGEALTLIQGNIALVNDHMQAIAHSSREQSTGLSEVNTAVNQMDQTTQQNAAMVEETNAASATLAKESARLRELMEQFNLGVGRSARHGGAQASTGRSQPAQLASRPASRKPATVGNLAVKSEDWQEF